MKVLIVYAHPERRSFNAALTATAREHLTAADHEVQVSDLYAMNFNPVSGRHNFASVKDGTFFKQQIEEQHASANHGFAPDIRQEIEKLEACDALIFQFPLWWFGLPAILKGWVDRVLVMGRIYGDGKWFDEGTFKGRRAMVSLTTGGPESIYAPDGLSGHIDDILRPINHGILRFVGFDVLPPFVAWSAAHVTDEQRRSYLGQYQRRLDQLWTADPIAYPSLNEYDPTTFQRIAKEN